MSIEALKKQLADGEITKEQFTSELKKLLDGEQITQEEHDEAAKAATEGGGNPSNPDEGGNGGLTQEQVEKMIQSATDKVRTDYSNELKEKQKEIDELKKEKMTDEQKAEYERQQWEKERDQREKDLQEREVKLHTVDKLREKEIPLEFRDILAGPNVEETDKRIDNFQSMWQKELEKKVNERFKDGGDDPGKNRKGPGSNIENPWKPETRNLTKQAQITKDDPDLAKRLKAEAGQ